ncbi:hypothetical protein ZWY2020_054812 [Hordeum vulgare]|nr:hypothetical protein ZWY2020_054812 [Hordeum vulgare]
MLQKEMGREPSGDKEEDDDPESTPGYPNIEKVLMIFVDVESKTQLKVINREVNMAAPVVAKYLDWMKRPVIFDQSDHLARIATLGRQTLVVDDVYYATFSL